MKAIDKSSSPLWVRILVWVLIGGLVAGTLAVAIMTIAQWDAEPQFDPNEPIMISPEDFGDLPPEILEQLELMQLTEDDQIMADLEDESGIVGEDAPTDQGTGDDQ